MSARSLFPFLGIACLACALVAEDLQVRVVTAEGREVLLTGPIGGDWEFAVGGYRITFKPQALKRVTQTSRGSFRMTLQSGEVLEWATPKSRGTISGKGEWGQTRLAWADVNAMEFVAPAAPEPAAAKDQKEPEWRAVSLAEVPVEFLPASRWERPRWKVDTGSFILDVEPDRVKSIERVSQRWEFRVVFDDGKEFTGTPVGSESALSGESRWGSSRIEFTELSRIVRIAPAAKAGESEKPRAVEATLAFQSGLTLGAWDFSGGFRFEFGGIEVEVDPRTVASIEALGEAGKFRLGLVQAQLKVSSEAKASFRAKTRYGEIEVPWRNIARITSASAPGPARSGNTLETKTGATLMVWGLQPAGVKAFGMDVRGIQWAAVATVADAPDGIELQDGKGLSVVLTGGWLAGSSVLGKVTVPMGMVRRIGAGRTPAPPAASTAAAKITLAGGTAMEASKVEIDGSVDGYTTWLKGFVEATRTDGLRYWIPKERLVEKGFRVENGQLLMPLGGVPQSLPLPNCRLSVATELVQLEGGIGSVRELAPRARPKPPAAGAAPRPATVTVVTRQGAEETFAALRKSFVNYPKFGWSGTYSVSRWPFQWWREEHIDIRNDESGAEMQVEIGQVASVDVVGESYSRKLHFRSLAGGELFAAHVWEGMNKASRSGPSTWEREREGVVLELEGGVYVFLPFVAVRTITFGAAQRRG